MGYLVEVKAVKSVGIVVLRETRTPQGSVARLLEGHSGYALLEIGVSVLIICGHENLVTRKENVDLKDESDRDFR